MNSSDTLIFEAMDNGFQQDECVYGAVTAVMGFQNAFSFDACAEDEEFTRWAESADAWEMLVPGDEAWEKLLNVGNPDC